MAMEVLQACREARELYVIWVGTPPADRPLDLDRIHASILQDYRWRRDKPQYASVVREMRGHLVKLGKIRKELSR